MAQNVICDIMSSDITVAGEAEFEANSGVAQVAVLPPGPGGLVFYNGNSNSDFLAGENIILTGASVNIPYGFGQGTGKAYVGIAWRDLLGNFLTIPELSGNSILVIPSLCGEIEFPPAGLYIPCPLENGPFNLCMTTLEMNVSQVNLPAILDLQTIKVQVHLKINHTRVLVT